MRQEKCPNCGKKLYYDTTLLLWRCRRCKRIYTNHDLQIQRNYARRPYGIAKKSRPRRTPHRTNYSKFFLSIVKLFLCLLVIAGIGIIAWTGYRLFTHQVASVIGTLVFLTEIGLLIWITRVLNSSRFRWRKPSFKLVFWPLVVVTLVCAFAGIEPMSSTKDRVISFVGQTWQTIIASSQSSTTLPVEQVPAASKLPPTIEPQPRPSEPPPTPTPQPPSLPVLEVEQETFRLINVERERAGVPPTKWDDKLYQLSKAHTEDMTNQRRLFHTPSGASYAENAWGASWGGIDRKNLAKTIVDSWMSSPLHRDWILHGPLRTSVVSIVDDNRGQYASWTFWMGEAGTGPPLVRKAYNLWISETGGSIPWLEWLYDIKGYPNDTSWLLQ